MASLVQTIMTPLQTTGNAGGTTPPTNPTTPTVPNNPNYNPSNWPYSAQGG
jgi:hypothetical protein